MAAKDRFHDAVKQALQKEEWVITADPLILKIDKVKFEIDLAAEKVFAAEKAGQKIAVEIKSFLNTISGDRLSFSVGTVFELSLRIANERTR